MQTKFLWILERLLPVQALCCHTCTPITSCGKRGLKHAVLRIKIKGNQLLVRAKRWCWGCPFSSCGQKAAWRHSVLPLHTLSLCVSLWVAFNGCNTLLCNCEAVINNTLLEQCMPPCYLLLLTDGWGFSQMGQFNSLKMSIIGGIHAAQYFRSKYWTS